MLQKHANKQVVMSYDILNESEGIIQGIWQGTFSKALVQNFINLSIDYVHQYGDGIPATVE